MDEKVAAALCSRLKELRTDKKLTQKEFAQKIGASSVSVSSYEIGAKTPSLDMMIRIATTFDVSLSWLCGLTERKSINKVFDTYTDIIDMFFDIMNIAHIDVYPVESKDPDIFSFFDSKWGIAFTDNYLCEFLKDWRKMRDLYLAKTIDEEVYSLWREKTILKYNIPIMPTKLSSNDPDTQIVTPFD